MGNYRFILEPYAGRNSRYTCPQCHKPHQFTRYIDTATGEMVAEHVGRCNRENKCGYHYTPRQYFADMGIVPNKSVPSLSKPKPPERPPSYIDKELLNNSLKDYEENVFVRFIHTIFDKDTVNHLVNRYKVGTSKQFGGGTTVFWQIDYQGNIRGGKLIKYAKDGHKGKNKKSGRLLISWVHSVLKIKDFNLKQCLFGEHLLKQYPDATVAIVESEKTAIIASKFMPEMVWLACGGVGGLNEEIVKPLRGRRVILFPDASKDGGMFDKWKAKADEFGFECSSLLERFATEEEKEQGVDIADYLVKQNQLEQKTEPQQISTTDEDKIGEEEFEFEFEEEDLEIPSEDNSTISVPDDTPLKNVIQKSLDLGDDYHNYLIKDRIFYDSTGRKIEIVGTSDLGRCDKSYHSPGKTCIGCLLKWINRLNLCHSFRSKLCQ